MTTETDFDRRASALLRDALDQELGPHPTWEDSPAADRVARRAERRPDRWPIRVPAIAAILVLGAAGAVLVGSWRSPDRLQTAEPLPPGQIPDELAGTWGPFEEGPAWSRGLRLRFTSPILVSEANGETHPDLGRVVDATRLPGTPPTFLVRIDGVCGGSRYSVVVEGSAIRFAPMDDACPDRVRFLDRTWAVSEPKLDRYVGPLTAGRTYTSGVFTEPFLFVMPAVDETGQNAGLPSQFRGAKPHVTTGGILMNGPWWSMRILDDLPVYADLCDAGSGTMPDLPATPGAVGDWLATERAWVVSDSVGIPVDGRTAWRFPLMELDLLERCRGSHLIPLEGEAWGEMRMRAYAIPTGDDTILLIGGSDAVNFKAVGDFMDAFVRSMDFE